MLYESRNGYTREFYSSPPTGVYEGNLIATWNDDLKVLTLGEEKIAGEMLPLLAVIISQVMPAVPEEPFDLSEHLNQTYMEWLQTAIFIEPLMRVPLSFVSTKLLPVDAMSVPNVLRNHPLVKACAALEAEIAEHACHETSTIGACRLSNTINSYLRREQREQG